MGDVLEKCDERNILTEMAEKLDLAHLLDRDVKQLSGGEMQRFAIACAVVRDAENYMFDEPSSFLDVRQRMTATEVLPELHLAPPYLNPHPLLGPAPPSFWAPPLTSRPSPSPLR